MKYAVTAFIITCLAAASDDLTGYPDGPGNGLVFPASNALLDTYAYDPSQMLPTMPASFGDYAAIDDITPLTNLDIFITVYACWGVTTGSVPWSLEMLFVADGGGFPSGAPLIQESCDVICYDSGYTFGGYTLWHCQMDLNEFPPVSVPGWLGSHRADGVSWYVACGTGITGFEAYRTTAAGWAWQPLSQSIGPGDIFKIVETYAWPPALERTTWAGIKTTFKGGIL